MISNTPQNYRNPSLLRSVALSDEAPLNGSHQLAALLARLLVELLVLLVLGPRQDSGGVTMAYAKEE